MSSGACNAVSYVSKQIGRQRDCTVPTKREEQYRGIRTMIKIHRFLDMDKLFDEFPKTTYPLDMDSYFHSGIECEMVVTNCVSGKAEYLSESNNPERLMKICRASSSLPYIADIVEIDGVPYFDGGLADSIPVRRALQKGYQKPVIVLTKEYGHRKEYSRLRYGMSKTCFRQYPKLADAIYYRAYYYNKTMEYVERWEQEGKVFVIRPEGQMIRQMERDREKMLSFYQHGRAQMKKKQEALQAFLQA